MSKEASARIKINDLLKESGWMFFDEKGKKANIILENQTKITQKTIDEFGNDFESSSKGFIDFLLLDELSHPIIVLEAKSEKHNPLVGKEQARSYARSQNCRFILLSNGNLHYFWDTLQGNPYIITKFPTPESMKGYEHYNPNPDALVNEIVTTGYIAITQKHDYDQNPDFHNEDSKAEYLKKHNLSLLRPYQVRAIVNSNKQYLLESAYGGDEGKEKGEFEYSC